MVRIGRRPLAVLVGLSVFALYAGAAFASYAALSVLWRASGSPWAAVAAVATFALTFGYLSYRFGTAQLLAGTGARELPRERAPRFHERLDRLCERMDVGRPDVYVADLDAPNAFALGGARDGALVLDWSLFRLLDPEERGAIVAHELAHLESHDGLVQTMAYTVVRTVAGLLLVALSPIILLALGVGRAAAWIRGRPLADGDPLFGLYRAIGDAVAAVLIVFTLLVRAHSRRREFAADDRAVEVIGDPLALANALETIRRATEPPRGILSPLYVRGDEEEDRLSRLFSTHPPMEDRIERLVEMARERRRTARTIPVG